MTLELVKPNKTGIVSLPSDAGFFIANNCALQLFLRKGSASGYI